MKIVAQYSHNKGRDFIKENHENELREVEEVIRLVDAGKCKTKESEEKTMSGKILYSPKDFNRRFAELFAERRWGKARIKVSTLVSETGVRHKGFREIDMVKNGLGVEIQFGKYAFMVYNVAAKMTIFHKQGIIDSGIEIVPMLSLAREMSTGVSYFEQMRTDLEYRGVSDIDIPVLVVGIDCVGEKNSKELQLNFI